MRAKLVWSISQRLSLVAPSLSAWRTDTCPPSHSIPAFSTLCVCPQVRLWGASAELDVLPRAPRTSPRFLPVPGGAAGRLCAGAAI